MQHDELISILKRLGRRVLVIDGAAGTVWGIVASLACLVCGVWLDLVLELPAELRLIVLGAAVLAAIAIALRRGARAIAAGAPSRLAARLDHVSGSGGQILSGVDLAGADTRSFQTHRPELSAGLARIAVERAARLAGAVSRSAAVPLDAVLRSVGTLVLVGGVALAFALLLPRLAATEWKRFADPFGDHPPFSTITFSVEPGDAEVIFGAGLEVRSSVSGPPVEGVELVLQTVDEPESGSNNSVSKNQANAGKAGDEEVVPMFPEQEGQWRASVANITRPLTYYLRARGARSPRFKISVLTVPQIEDVQFRVTPPAYTQQAAYEGPLRSGGLAGLPATAVRISIRSNRPLSAGKLAYVVGQSRQEFPLVVAGRDNEHEVAGRFAISGSGRIEAWVVDVAGRASNEKFSAPVTQLVDERPFVRLVEPMAVSFATPTAVIPVVVSAEDDYGVARLQLFRSLNDSRYLPADVPVADPPPRLVHQVIPLPLGDYGLEPGDEIKLFARVEDNDPHAGSITASPGPAGKGAESSVVLIRIISQAEFDRHRQTRDAMEMLMAKYRQASRRMESVAEEIEKLQQELRELKEGQTPSAELREKLHDLADQMGREAEALQKLAAEKQPFEIDEQLTKQLQERAEKIDQLQKRAQELADDEQAPREEIEKQLAELAAALREQREQLDNEALQPLEKLKAVFPLTRDQQRFVQLYLRQRDLADRLASLKGRDREDDPQLKARMRDLEDEQRKLHSDLEALLGDIEEHAAGLPEEIEFAELRESALEFVEALRESGAQEAMAEAADGLEEFSGTRGHAGALQAADILEQFLDKGQQMGQGAGQCLGRFRPQLADAMNQTLQQMLEGMGFGTGSGYSAARNNVGLYGNDPNYNQSPSGGGDGPSQKQQRGGSARRAPGRMLKAAGDEPIEAPGSLRASGAADAAIPLRYRRQVGRYFQRVADELGDSEK